MLKVGIHENVQGTKAVKNDRGTLIFTIQKVTGDALAGLDDASDSSATSKQEQDFMFLTPFATTFGGEPDTADNNLGKIKELKDQLTHILLGYMTQDKIKWDTLKDTGVTRENMAEKCTQQGIVDLMYKNVVDQFITMITPYIGPSSPLFRTVLTRTSKAKHFPTFRKKFLAENPFWEPMSVPAGQSKIAFTKWEKANGYDSGEKVTIADTVDATQAQEAHDILS